MHIKRISLRLTEIKEENVSKKDKEKNECKAYADKVQSLEEQIKELERTLWELRAKFDKPNTVVEKQNWTDLILMK